ncbi:MAG: IS110 family transposase [Gaiellaceae bacterium]
MIYVGIDLHRKRSHVTALAEDGNELLSGNVANEPEALRAILAELGGEARVALEATFGREWLAELLEADEHELHCISRIRCGRGRSRRRE